LGPTRPHYRAVFISPHLDDAVFSCGGLITQLLTAGPVLVINVFTRYLADLKIHGAVMGAQRNQEERGAAAFLGYESRSLDELDAPFRRDAYRKLGNLFRPPCELDMAWLPTLRARLLGLLDGIDFDQLYVPLGIGWHVDHVLTHLAFDTWAERSKLLYYEDAPYCCIPHATRYRLNDLAHAPVPAGDASLAPASTLLAWQQAASAYANTALMKNLQPWIVRQLALPAVSFYLFRLMAQHRHPVAHASQHLLQPLLLPMADQLERKVDAMALYPSQFGEFFVSRQDCLTTLTTYAQTMGQATGAVERYWTHQAQVVT